MPLLRQGCADVDACGKCNKWTRRRWLVLPKVAVSPGSWNDNTARNARDQQSLRRREGAERRQFHRQAGRDPCPGGRERRRQVDVDEGVEWRLSQRQL